jgi:diguanylate cyclase (GGDEF)-like protein
VEVVDGHEALEQITKRRYQAVVIDLDAQEQSADLELIRAAVAAPGSPGVVVCASNPTVELAVTAMHMGAGDFLTNPVKREILLTALDTVLQKRSATLELVSLRRLVGVFNSLQNLESTYTQLRQSIADLFHAQGCTLALLDAEKGEIVAQTSHYGANGDLVPQHRFRLADSRISKLIFESGEPFISNHIPEDPLFEPAQGTPKTTAGLENLMAVPMRSASGPIGFIYVVNRPADFSRLDSELLLSIGEQTGMALKSAHTFDEHYRASITDPLTDLYNRRFFDARLRQEAARVRRTKKPMGVMFVDLDRFKQINDQHGHEAGNLVLTSIANILRQCIRSADVPARWGGDEFTVLLAEAEPESLEMIARRVRDTVRDTDWAAIGPVTATIGVAVMPQDADTLEGLLKAADDAMYLAKKRGKNTYALACELPKSPEKQAEAVRVRAPSN